MAPPKSLANVIAPLMTAREQKIVRLSMWEYPAAFSLPSCSGLLKEPWPATLTILLKGEFRPSVHRPRLNSPE